MPRWADESLQQNSKICSKMSPNCSKILNFNTLKTWNPNEKCIQISTNMVFGSLICKIGGVRAEQLFCCCWNTQNVPFLVFSGHFYQLMYYFSSFFKTHTHTPVSVLFDATHCLSLIVYWPPRIDQLLFLKLTWAGSESIQIFTENIIWTFCWKTKKCHLLFVLVHLEILQ